MPSPVTPREPSSTHGTVSAKTARRAVSKTMPRVARPHSAVDLDQAKASASKKKERREFSDAQKKALREVYMLHLVELDRWRRLRKLQLYKDGKGSEHARWTPSWPRVPWEAVAHDPRYGIFADTPDHVRTWCKQFGKVWRRDIRNGGYDRLPPLPDWAVRTVVGVGRDWVGLGTTSASTRAPPPPCLGAQRGELDGAASARPVEPVGGRCRRMMREVPLARSPTRVTRLSQRYMCTVGPRAVFCSLLCNYPPTCSTGVQPRRCALNLKSRRPRGGSGGEGRAGCNLYSVQLLSRLALIAVVRALSLAFHATLILPPPRDYT